MSRNVPRRHLCLCLLSLTVAAASFLYHTIQRMYDVMLFSRYVLTYSSLLLFEIAEINLSARCDQGNPLSTARSAQLFLIGYYFHLGYSKVIKKNKTTASI